VMEAERLAFIDGELQWLPEPPADDEGRTPAPPGKFAVVLARRQRRDLALEAPDFISAQGGRVIGDTRPPSRWARIQWSKKTAGRWRRCGGHDWHAIPAKGWPGLLLRGLPTFPAIGPDARPGRVVWWIRRGGRLTRVRAAAAAPLKQRVATVYHFCPAPGCIARVEIVDLSTVPGWPAEAERLNIGTPWNLAEELARIRERLSTAAPAGSAAAPDDVRRAWVASALPCVDFVADALTAEKPDAERVARAAPHLGECLARRALRTVPGFPRFLSDVFLLLFLPYQFCLLNSLIIK